MRLATPSSVTIALTRYAEPDWLILQALESLSRQQGVSAEVLLLDQTPSRAIARQCEALSTPTMNFKHQEIPAKSLSFARNEAIRLAAADRILFLDADAVAEPNWASALDNALALDAVAVVGTRILPRWHRRPLIIARSGIVLDQYSIYDLGSEQRPIHRIVGASFGIHRGRLGSEAYFDEKLGRSKGTLLSGEESNLCRRAIEHGLKVLYEGRVLVYHQILPERISYRWVLRRFFYTGINRSQLGGAPNPSNSFDIWDYLALPVVLPSYIAGYLYGRYMRRHTSHGQP